MNRRPLAAVAAAFAFFSVIGCGLLGSDDSSVEAAPAPTPSATSAAADTGLGSVKDAGDIPDPCTLLTDDQVVELTGREITQRDEDGAGPGSATRFCQWQQPSGQLAVFLSRTTPSDYELVIEEATPVNDLGDRAFELAGHLYVLYGTVQVDVYSRGDSDAENLAKATQIVEVLLPKI